MNKKKDSYLGYNIVSNILKFAGNIWFGGKVIGKENIPKNGPCILAGNHESNFDAYLLFKGSKRPIHILGKIELFKGPFGFFFKMMHLIPVDRKNKNPLAKEKSLEILNDGKVLAIFPEGTFHKKDIILPFKPGAISFATKSGAPIIPFSIVGTFKFRSHPIIKFGKPIYINEINSEDKVKYLEDIVRNMIIYLKNSKENL